MSNIAEPLPVVPIKFRWRRLSPNHVARLDGPADDPITAQLRRSVIGWLGELRRPPRTLRETPDHLNVALGAFFEAECDGPLSPLWCEGTGIPQRRRWRRSAGSMPRPIRWDATSLADDHWAAPALGCDRWVATALGYKHTLEAVQLPVGSDMALHYMAFVDTLPLMAPTGIGDPLRLEDFSDPLRAMGAAEKHLARKPGIRWRAEILDEHPKMDSATNAVIIRHYHPETI
jgi:hypothetical protein